MKIIRGTLVEHKEFDYGVGRAAHKEPTGERWVAWTGRSGSWAAGLYKPSKLRAVGCPEVSQARLRLDIGRS